MYKYKKTIIINNRRRRIFSKEKSNTEYILYKKEYITLNAYNKKTGGVGGFMSYFTKKKTPEKNEFEIPEKNEFEIPNKIIHRCSIIDEDGIKFGLNRYDRINSIIISDHLKSDKIWLITEYDIKNPNMTVKGYNDQYQLLNEINSEDGIKKYGETNQEIFNKIIKMFKFVIFNETSINVSELDKNKFLKFNKTIHLNADGRNIYDTLVDVHKYYIYYYTTNYNEFGKNINEGEYIKYNNCTLKCIKINVEGQPGNFTYDILFKYISTKNTENELLINGGKEFNKIYNSLNGENKVIFPNSNNIVYNESVSHDERKLYDKINKSMIGIYLIEDYSNKIDEMNKMDEIIIGSNVVKHHTNFTYFTKINQENCKYIIYKYLGDYINQENIIIYGISYGSESIKRLEIIPKSALLYYEYANIAGQNIYDELLKENIFDEKSGDKLPQYIYYAKKFSNSSREVLEYTKDKESKLFNTDANFKCDNIMREYPSSYESTIVYKYIGNTPTIQIVTAGGQRKYKNLKSKKYLK